MAQLFGVLVHRNRTLQTLGLTSGHPLGAECTAALVALLRDNSTLTSLPIGDLIQRAHGPHRYRVLDALKVNVGLMTSFQRILPLPVRLSPRLRGKRNMTLGTCRM
jgi:hypothetical protein